MQGKQHTVAALSFRPYLNSAELSAISKLVGYINDRRLYRVKCLTDLKLPNLCRAKTWTDMTQIAFGTYRLKALYSASV